MVWEAKWELGELGQESLLGGAPVRGTLRGQEQVEFSGSEALWSTCRVQGHAALHSKTLSLNK